MSERYADRGKATRLCRTLPALEAREAAPAAAPGACALEPDDVGLALLCGRAVGRPRGVDMGVIWVPASTVGGLPKEDVSLDIEEAEAEPRGDPDLSACRSETAGSGSSSGASGS